MSNYTVLSLMAKQHKDAEKLAVRATELLKELDPKNEQGVHFDLYKTRDGREEGIQYDSYTPEKMDLAIKVIIGVAATFPEMKLRYYVNSEGPLIEAGESRNGELVEMELWQTVVHLENSIDYQRVLTYLQDDPEIDVECSLTRCSPMSLGWEYDHLTEEELNDKRLQRLSKHFPDMTIKCFKYNIADEEHGDIAFSVSSSTFRNEKPHWNSEYNPEIKDLLAFFGGSNVKGISSYEDILFHSERIPLCVKGEVRADSHPCNVEFNDDLPF